MLKLYNIVDGRPFSSTDPEAKVQVYVSPTEEERAYLVNELLIDEHTLASALDPEELSRIEFEPEHVAIIYKRPKNYSADDDFLFRISSVGLFLFDERLIVVTREDANNFSTGKDMSRLRDLQELMLRLIGRSISQFLGHLHAMGVVVDEIETLLETSMNNRHILQLFKLGQSMTYYLSAISANGVLIERLRVYAHKVGFSTENIELLDDLIVDNTQCYKQAEIASSIMAGMSDARASVVNNNLNMLMKRLTVLSIVFLPLNVIASMFGMSEWTSFTADHLSWPVSYTLFTIALVVIAYITYWLLKRTGVD